MQSKHKPKGPDEKNKTSAQQGIISGSSIIYPPKTSPSSQNTSPPFNPPPQTPLPSSHKPSHRPSIRDEHRDHHGNYYRDYRDYYDTRYPPIYIPPDPIIMQTPPNIFPDVSRSNYSRPSSRSNNTLLYVIGIIILISILLFLMFRYQVFP